MASQEMETLKTGMKMMMEKGFAPKFDGKMKWSSQRKNACRQNQA